VTYFHVSVAKVVVTMRIGRGVERKQRYSLGCLVDL